MTITTPSKQKPKKLLSTTPKTPGMDRSISVQGIISAQDKVSYEQVFKTRNRVIDDRQTPPPTNLKDSPMVMKELFSGSKTILESPTKGKYSDSKSLKDSDGAKGDLKDILRASSEIFLLPQAELKYLDQYRVDTMKLRELEQRIEFANKKIKEIAKYINYQIVKEQVLMTPTVIKIQAWWRGIRVRKRLAEEGKLLGFNRQRFYPDLRLANESATIIQARWRGCKCRFENQSFQYNLLKRMIAALRIQVRESFNVKADNSEIEILKQEVSNQGAEILALKETILSQAELISAIQTQLDQQEVVE